MLLAPLVPAVGAPVRRLSEEEQRQWTSALEAFRTGDWSESAHRFRSLAARPSLLAEYARFLLAQSLWRLGDLAGARQAAESIVSRTPDSRLVPLSLLLVSNLAAQQQEEAAAEKGLRRFLSQFSQHPVADHARYLLGLSLYAQGRLAEAAGVFKALWLTVPASAYGQAAGDQLALLAQKGVALPPPTAVERLERAERLLSAGVAGTAGDEAEALVSEQPGPEIALRALRVSAGAWRQSGRHDLAARSVERALAIEPRPELLLDLARLRHRAGSKELALAAVERLLRDAPSASEVPDALLLRGRIFEDAGDRAESAATYRRIWKEFADSEAAGVALWRLAWLESLEGEWLEAARRFSSLTTLRSAPAFRIASAYWAGRSKEAAGAGAEARRFYALVLKEAPRGYYGLLAARRTGSVSGGDGGNPPPLPANPLDSLAGDLRFAKVEALRSVGLSEWASLELDELLSRSPGDPAKLYGVSGAYVREAQYHLALRILRQHFTDLSLRGSERLPRAFWEMLYPLGWESEIRAAAARAGLDPFFVAAVAREESNFYPGARSRVGARGLMQLMPDTARQVASRQGVEFGRGELLDEPGANLRLGAAFLAGLMREFSDPRLAVAAYNAGPARVREWWQARRSDDLEIFVERIPFDETRHFVKRVLASWEEYRRIYRKGSSPAASSERP
jgi:soluble lytic murein transglycosylase